MILDENTIRDLIDFTDEHGVLSFYVGNTPDKAAAPQPTTPLELRGQFKQVVARLEDDDPRLARAVDERFDRLQSDIDTLVDPRAHGRGRALFVAVSSGETATVALQIPFRDRVVHHDSAYVRPLVAANDEGRPAGVLVVSRVGARLLRWSGGEAEEMEEHDFELGDAQRAGTKAGPSVGNPEHPWHGNVNRERFEDRIDENRHRFLREVAERVSARAKEQGWDRLVLSGSPKVRDLLRDVLPTDDGFRLLVADASWEDAPAHRIADAAWPLLRSVHLDRERVLAEAAVERHLAGGAGAVGVAAVCDALNEGRVAHLLFQEDLQLEGFRSEEGTLHPARDSRMEAAEVSLRPEPLFVERLIERAVTTGAAVTAIDQAATPALAEHGVGALLRW